MVHLERTLHARQGAVTDMLYCIQKTQTPGDIVRQLLSDKLISDTKQPLLLQQQMRVIQKLLEASFYDLQSPPSNAEELAYKKRSSTIRMEPKSTSSHRQTSNTGGVPTRILQLVLEPLRRRKLWILHAHEVVTAYTCQKPIN